MIDYQFLLAVSDYYSIILTVNGIVLTIIYSFVFYAIVFYTPKTICSRVKYGLLCWTTACFFVGGLKALWQPVPILPYSCNFFLSFFTPIFFFNLFALKSLN